jgi:hypothetical protein
MSLFFKIQTTISLKRNEKKNQIDALNESDLIILIVLSLEKQLI